MCTIKSIYKCVLALMIGTQSAQGADTAANYQAYIDKAIPMSRTFAEKDAKFRESLLIFDKISEAQQKLLQISDLSRLVEKTVKSVPKQPQGCGADILERATFKTLFDNLSWYMQLENTLADLDTSQQGLWINIAPIALMDFLIT